MDVFGELDVELLAVELEAEQSFMTDGLGADGIIPEAQITSEVAQLEAGQAFDEFNAMNAFASLDAPQNFDGQNLNAELALNGVLADWLEAFVNADDGASLDAKDNIVLMDEIIVTAPRTTDIWDISISAEEARAMFGDINVLQYIPTQFAPGEGGFGPWALVPPPPAPEGGVEVDRDGLTIENNEDTAEQEAAEDTLALVWNAQWLALGGDPSVEWGAEYNESTGKMHVYQLEDLIG